MQTYTEEKKDFFTAQYSDDSHEAYSPLRILDLGSLLTLLLPKRVFVTFFFLQVRVSYYNKSKEVGSGDKKNVMRDLILVIYFLPSSDPHAFMIRIWIRIQQG
jgi:hypothetical protein